MCTWTNSLRQMLLAFLIEALIHTNTPLLEHRHSRLPITHSPALDHHWALPVHLHQNLLDRIPPIAAAAAIPGLAAITALIQEHFNRPERTIVANHWTVIAIITTGKEVVEVRLILLLVWEYQLVVLKHLAGPHLHHLLLTPLGHRIIMEKGWTCTHLIKTKIIPLQLE